ncbi:diacylglycerol kinase [Ezakiella peruensis]|uniref:diacylglycerol kinase n=1 Tax=Ezakiella peruensis TaxID=1464038 RepID=UPI000C1B5053|nr:diacylglycerol kinase [Ezakiella peruensis]
MKDSKFLKSFNNAANGLVQVFKTERNMKFHFLVAGLVMLAGLMFNLNKQEFVQLITAIVFVLFAEMINTSIEYLVDATVKDFNPIVKVVKDVAAGAVLLSAFYACIVGYLIFYDKLVPAGRRFLGGIHQNPVHLTVIAVGLTVLLIIALKSRYSKERGSYFQGGVVSGHSAISFLMATIILFNANSALVITLGFILAMLVAESRIEGKIHKPMDTIYGAMLGIIIGIFIFLIFG